MTPYQVHCSRWNHCQRCGLSKVRKQVVTARGRLPCEILFVGEAPGISENSIGVPFVGPAGKLLDSQVESACSVFSTIPAIAFVNLVGCIPLDENTNRKNSEPTANEIEACRPRLEELFKLAKPKLVVCVGDLSWQHATQGNWAAKIKANVVHVKHPAAILREPIQTKGLSSQRVIVQLIDAFTELYDA